MRWGILAAAIALHHPAMAQDLSELRRCAALTGDKARLECFDKAMKPPAAAPVRVSRWQISETVEVIDETKRIIAVVRADGFYTEHAAVVVRCIRNTVDVLVAWPTYLGINDVPAQWRADGGAIHYDYWSLVSSGRGVYVDHPRQFLSRISGRRALVVSLTPPNDRPGESISFPIEGVDAAIKPLLEACKY